MMEVVLTIAIIADVITNIFLLAYSSRWEDTKRRYMRELEKQNEELREFIKKM